ncbi:MAG: hypothetical protein KatS3mg051_1024 [Anaerolineae bacterium]|nr:MAG: hypothetical protein KatS3mg051_1024 [Anaerolineae bacterium]
MSARRHAPKVWYEFSGGMCWECTSHRAVFGAEAGPDDWELLVVTFSDRDATNAGLFQVLSDICHSLGIQRLDFRPRLNPYATRGGRMLLSLSGRDDAEIAFGAMATGHDRGSFARVDGQRWLAVEEVSIEGRRCWDVVVHAEMRVCSQFLNLLYKWNWEES